MNGEISTHIIRARITVLGFALALYLFGTGIFVSFGQELRVSAAWVFLTSLVPICVGFALALGALVLFATSQRLSSPNGHGDVWTFSVAELLMYQALAQALGGTLQNYIVAIGAAFKGLGSVYQDPALLADLRGSSAGLLGWLFAVIGLVWFGVTYVAPVAFLWRHPFNGARKRILAAFYVVLLLIVFWVSAYPYRLHARAGGRPGSMGYFFVMQFWQPRLWGYPPAVPGPPPLYEQFGAGQ